jgi:Zn-dependent protease
VANVAAALLCRLILLPLGVAMEFVTSFIPLSLFFGLLNLLPLQGFDGARILLCFLCARHRAFTSLDPFCAQRLVHGISSGMMVLLWLLSMYVLLRCGSALSLYLFCLQLFRSVAFDSPQKSSI